MSSDTSNLSMYQDFFLKERNIKLEKEIFEGSSVAFQGYHETFKKRYSLNLFQFLGMKAKTLNMKLKH